MTIESHRFNVGGVAVDIVRKDIKNLHLGVYPPGGHVRAAGQACQLCRNRVGSMKIVQQPPVQAGFT